MKARAAGKRVAAHLAHLVVHGALHLAGHDHAEAGEAEAGDDDAGDLRVEVGEQLLEAEEVPRRLRDVRRDGRVRHLLERGADEG